MTSDRCTYAKNDWEFQPLKIQNHKNHKNHNCQDVSEHFHTTTWLGSITFYVLAQQLFGASASVLYRLATAPLSTRITTWFPQKIIPWLCEITATGWFFWISTSRFQSTLKFETSDFQSKNARQSPSIWLSTLRFRVNLVTIICNFSCYQKISRAKKRPFTWHRSVKPEKMSTDFLLRFQRPKRLNLLKEKTCPNQFSASFTWKESTSHSWLLIHHE